MNMKPLLIAFLAILFAVGSRGHASTKRHVRLSVDNLATAEECGAVTTKVDCSSGVGALGSGEPDLLQAQCEARGCCFDNTSFYDKEYPYCFYSSDGVPVTTVHMVNANHFDAGYTALTKDGT